MRANAIIIAGMLLITVILTARLKPEDLQKGETMITDHGIVTEMHQTVLKDFVVKLKDNPKSYYLDLDEHMTLDELKNKLLYQSVVVQYPDNWGTDGNHYVSKLETNGSIVFNDEEE